MILNAVEGKSLPVYGDGKNIRDWLYVEDHCEAVWLIINKGIIGETYNIGGECEKKNIEVVNNIYSILNGLYPATDNPALGGRSYKELISFVKDRPGHDKRYAINCDKLKKELGWRQVHDFEIGLRLTVNWYLENMEWVEGIRSGDYMKWIEQNYAFRACGFNE
jgi:dTDP-glucose 4,6-dehydratase